MAYSAASWQGVNQYHFVVSATIPFLCPLSSKDHAHKEKLTCFAHLLITSLSEVPHWGGLGNHLKRHDTQSSARISRLCHVKTETSFLLHAKLQRIPVDFAYNSQHSVSHLHRNWRQVHPLVTGQQDFNAPLFEILVTIGHTCELT